MNLLVAGGTGYIGSHTCVALLEAGYTVIIVDNLCNSKAGTIDKIRKITSKGYFFYPYAVVSKCGIFLERMMKAG